MPATMAGKKLDLSKLTDEEAKHVWEVIQRDFDLRKKEEDRLGELKTRVEKEDTKTELLGNQTSLTESHCIRCLQPFKFLLISKHQCLDCQLHICKFCGRFNKTEQGWVCNACHMARVLKIGTLEWYYENVRARFKHFGSAKVMRSLFKRLNVEHSCSQSSLREGYEEHSLDATDTQTCKETKKIKRRLTVDPFDFNLDSNYYSKARGQSNQNPCVHDFSAMNVDVKELYYTEEEMVTVFHQILEEQHKGIDLEMTSQQDDLCSEHRTVPSPSTSRLSYSSCGSGSGLRGASSSYRLVPGESEEEDEHSQPYLLYQSHRGTYSHTSQESLYSGNPPVQITDLNLRMSVIETMLNRIEQKVTSTYDQAPPTSSSTSPLPQLEAVDLEEQQLRQKLHELTDNISDHSSDEESAKPHSPQKVLAWRSPQWDLKSSRIPTRCNSRTRIVGSSLGEELNSQKTNHSLHNLEWKGHLREDGVKANFKGSTALLFELEDKVAEAAVSVQNAESEVSYIENKIAALKTSGMTVDGTRRNQ
ncbi:melanophilin isoform X2 [Gouania willdenowi]|uniref:melanophilin isoform X2 n=1 Tax=Gouania willdenowi TaxID=441366 RepID=UPI001054EFCA|nr:melanophilin-like isoform X2 [Gouania willdenowi]